MPGLGIFTVYVIYKKACSCFTVIHNYPLTYTVKILIAKQPVGLLTVEYLLANNHNRQFLSAKSNELESFFAISLHPKCTPKFAKNGDF